MSEPSHRPISTRKVPRFAGIPTFLRLPPQHTAVGLDVMLFGAPFDGGTTFRPGARFGPRAVRLASALTRGFHPDPGLDLFEHLRCADGGDVATVPMSVNESLRRIEERVTEIAVQGAISAMVGGDHTVSLGALRALAKQHGPLGLVHFDAHSDTYGPAWDQPIHHGTVFRNAVEEGLLRSRGLLQIGIRGPLTEAHDHQYAQSHGFRIIPPEAVKQNLAAVRAQIAALRDSGPIYVSFDMDCLDPAYAPGTGTPVPGGLSSYEALELVRGLSGLTIVGLDVVEISPDHDTTGNTALVAVTLLSQMLASIAAGKRGLS